MRFLIPAFAVATLLCLAPPAASQTPPVPYKGILSSATVNQMIADIAAAKLGVASNNASLAAMYVASTFGRVTVNSGGYLSAPNVNVGGATTANGPPDWLTALSPGTAYPNVRPFMSTAPIGGVGAAGWFAARTSDASQGTFPVINCFNKVDAQPVVNGMQQHYNSWCAYLEMNATSVQPGYAVNEENSVYTTWTPVAKHPFLVNPLGGTNNLRLDCGKGPNLPSTGNCSTALEIISNGGKYLTGVLFGDGTLVPQADGIGEAIGLAPLQAIKFHFSGSEPAWKIFYDGAGNVYGRQIELNDVGMVVNATIVGTNFRQTAFTPPPSSNSICAVGQFGSSAGYYYWCDATDHWKRTLGADF